jgi:hypothetical protein
VLHGLDGFGGVRGLTGDDLAPRLEQLSRRAPEQGVIVDDQDARRHGGKSGHASMLAARSREFDPTDA